MRFPNGNKEITVGIAHYGTEPYIFLRSKRKGDTTKNRYIDLNRSQALQLAKAIEFIAESLP